MSLKLKVCGMCEEQNLLELSALKPDYVGFIFYPKSPRFFNASIPDMSSEIIKTGVFVNSSISQILAQVERFALSAIQLHGDEEATYCKDLKEALLERAERIEVIKAIGVSEQLDFDALRQYEKWVDYFLFDTRGNKRGGNGISFDWNHLDSYDLQTPFFLSGGIGPEHVEPISRLLDHLKNTNRENLLYGIDVNSRFESRAGFKDMSKIELFKQQLYNELSSR